METEQMAEVYGRQPMGSSRPRLKVDQQTSIRVGHPFEARALAAFVATASPDAEVSITTHMGGSQRDPEVTGYTLIARWVS